MQERLRKIIEQIEARPLTLGTWAVTLLAIIIGRIWIENTLESLRFVFADEFFYQFSHHLFTFGTIYLFALPVVVWAGRVSLKQAANLLLAGFFLIWTPPIIDEIISRGAGFWSFYTFDSLAGLVQRYFTFFGDQPDVGITYGIRVEVFLAIVFVALYAWVKTRSFSRAISAAIILYTLLFLMGALPSIATLLIIGPNIGFLSVTEHDVARFILSPTPLFGLDPPSIARVISIKMSLIYSTFILPLIAALIFTFFRRIFWELVNNIRFPQLLYHVGLLFIGAGLASFYGESIWIADFFHFSGVLVLTIAVSCAWLASVVVNDLRDVDIDRITNRHRPLVTGAIDVPTYRTIGLLLFAGSIFLAGLVSTQAALLLVLYQALAWVYSADPLRLKRIPIVATALAAMASLLILFAGFIVFSAEKNISALPVSIPVLLFFAYLAIIPIKDLKDIEGDCADSVRTLPVIWGEDRAKRFIGAAVFIVFALSPFVLSIRSLFPLGLFFGALGYWLLQLSSADHRYLAYRKLPGWFLLLATGYGAFLAAALSR
ncbi:MAG: UbiA family prenyltransferase [Candidatus Moraniibacteriota bacterium]